MSGHPQRMDALPSLPLLLQLSMAGTGSKFAMAGPSNLANS